MSSPLTFIWVLFFPFLFSCQAQSEKSISETATVFMNAKIIDVNDGSINPGHVITDSGRIHTIIPTNKEPDWEQAMVIDATEKYLLPGLTEMHAHIPSVSWGDPFMQETLFLYLSNGITTIRGMLGHPLHLELKEKAAEGEVLSPRIYTSSPSLNGQTVTNVEMARKMVMDYHQEGYDFLKFHPGLRQSVFDEIIKTAKEVEIPFAGHVSTDVGIRNALKSDYASIDHVDGYLEGLVPKNQNVNPSENGFFGYNFTALTDTSLIPELVRLSKEHQVWVVPTQSLFTRWFSPIPAEELAKEPEMKYMNPETLNQWVESKKRLTGSEGYSPQNWEKFMAIRNQLILQLHQNGQGLLLGSDAPQVFNVPGFSIHHELKAIIEAGLNPLEAIQIGTLHPARFFKEEGNFGEITEGASADLILLDHNPLENIENIKNPVGVMVKGKWISRQEIQRRLDLIAEKYQSK